MPTAPRRTRSWFHLAALLALGAAAPCGSFEFDPAMATAASGLASSSHALAERIRDRATRHAESGGRAPVERDWSGVKQAFGYRLGGDIVLSLAAVEGASGARVRYHRRGGLFRARRASEDLEGCFSGVTGDPRHMTGFTFESPVPVFVSESLGHADRIIRLQAVTRIVPGPAGAIWPPYVTESDISFLDGDGRVLKTVRQSWEIFVGLTRAYPIFTEESRLCR